MELFCWRNAAFVSKLLAAGIQNHQHLDRKLLAHFIEKRLKYFLFILYKSQNSGVKEIFPPYLKGTFNYSQNISKYVIVYFESFLHFILLSE